MTVNPFNREEELLAYRAEQQRKAGAELAELKERWLAYLDGDGARPPAGTGGGGFLELLLSARDSTLHVLALAKETRAHINRTLVMPIAEATQANADVLVASALRHLAAGQRLLGRIDDPDCFVRQGQAEALREALMESMSAAKAPTVKRGRL